MGGGFGPLPFFRARGFYVRAISVKSGYRLIAVHEESEVLADGSRRRLKPGVVCEFQQGSLYGITNWELEAARRSFKFTGATEEEFTHEPIDPITRLSSFDTDIAAEQQGWTEETKRRVEEALRSNVDGGKPDGYIIVEKPKMKPPWPRYDELVPQGQRTLAHVGRAIAEKVVELGLDPDDVAVYERSNRNRAEVLACLAEIGEPAPDEIVVPA